MRKLTPGKTPTFSFLHGATDRGEVKQREKSRAEEGGGVGGGGRSWFHPEKLKQQMKGKGEQIACFYYICYIFLLICIQVIILSCHTQTQIIYIYIGMIIIIMVINLYYNIEVVHNRISLLIIIRSLDNPVLDRT